MTDHQVKTGRTSQCSLGVCVQGYKKGERKVDATASFSDFSCKIFGGGVCCTTSSLQNCCKKGRLLSSRNVESLIGISLEKNEVKFPIQLVYQVRMTDVSPTGKDSHLYLKTNAPEWKMLWTVTVCRRARGDHHPIKLR